MDWIANFLNAIIDAIFSFFTFIWDIILAFLEWFVDTIKWLFFWLLGWVFDTFLNIIEGALKFIGLPTAFEWSAGFYAQINYFVPLNELFIAMLFLFGLWLGCFIVKVLLKLVPSVY